MHPAQLLGVAIHAGNEAGRQLSAQSTLTCVIQHQPARQRSATLRIQADKVTVRQDQDGYQYGSASGNPASFRQKRDGADEYIEGEAERIEYNGKLDRVEFFNHARLKREPADEVRGNYISYDSRTEYFTVTGGAGPSAGGASDGRVHAVIQPRNTTEGGEKTPAPGAPTR